MGVSKVMVLLTVCYVNTDKNMMKGWRMNLTMKLFYLEELMRIIGHKRQDSPGDRRRGDRPFSS